MSGSLFRMNILADTSQYFMPVWVQVMVGIAAAAVASGIIWKKVVQPVARLITLMDKALPLLIQLVEQFEDTPHAFAVLNEIIHEFRTNSGSSLRDCVNRLEAAARENKAASEVLAVNVEAARQLAAQDRAQIANLVVLLETVSAKQRESIKTVDRLEAGGRLVAQNLDEAQTRAEQVEGGEPGAAADAAVRRTP